jgi:hypothetical protein
MVVRPSWRRGSCRQLAAERYGKDLAGGGFVFCHGIEHDRVLAFEIGAGMDLTLPSTNEGCRERDPKSIFCAEVQAELGRGVCAADLDGDFGPGAVFVEEGIDAFEQQRLPPGGDHL